MDKQPFFYEIKTGITRSFLLPCQGGYLLIDTAYAHQFDKFRRLIYKIGVPPEQIRFLMLTHHHHDHTGFAAQLQTLSGCRLIYHKNAIENLQSGTVSQTMKPLNRSMHLALNVMRPFMPKAEFEPLNLSSTDVVIADETVKTELLLGLPGSILHTPGHSADSISFVLDNGHAFVGDVMMNLPLYGLRKRPFLLENEDAVRTSWKKLEAAGAKHFHPAHGSTFGIEKLKRAVVKKTP